MTELATLKLGGMDAAVTVQEQIEAPQEQNATPAVVAFSEQLFETYKNGATWARDAFQAHGGSDIVQAIRLFAQKVNYERGQNNESSFNVLELEEITVKQAVSLAPPLQSLCRWTILVRVGVRKLQRDLLGLISMIPMPQGGSVKLNRPTDSVGKTHYVVSHLFGERFVCRGYNLRIEDNGDWVLGGQKGNKWLKDLWLTPGLQSVDSLVAAKRRKLTPPSQRKLPANEIKRIDRSCDDYRAKLEKARASAGMKAAAYGAAHGARLDLENKDIMQAALATVRSLLAQAIVYHEDSVLDDIAGRQGCTKSEIINDRGLAGKEEGAFNVHLERRRKANQQYRACRMFAIPKGYSIFSEGGAPALIPDTEKTELTGVSGVAVSAAYTSTCNYAAELRRHHASLPEVEDLSPLIDACGVSTINGKAVIGMTLISRNAAGIEIEVDADGKPLEEGGIDYMQYTVEGEEPAEMLLSEFLYRTSVRFVPMVLDAHRRRLFAEDMQGTRQGVSFELSFEDVNERFLPCRKNSN